MSKNVTPESDQIAAIRARLLGIRDKATKAAEAAQQIAEEANNLWTELLPDHASEDRGILKRPDGRLNDQGIKAINAAFASGMGVVEAAKTFDISPSAASTRRSRWLASTTARSATVR